MGTRREDCFCLKVLKVWQPKKLQMKTILEDFLEAGVKSINWNVTRIFICENGSRIIKTNSACHRNCVNLMKLYEIENGISCINCRQVCECGT